MSRFKEYMMIVNEESANKKMFARPKGKNYKIFDADGSVVTKISKGKVVYPVGSDKSVRYEHPEGIVLSPEDIKTLGIEIE